MKLVIAIVQDNDVNLIMDDLVENEFSVTKLSTTGGFLREGNTTLLLGVEENRLQEAISLIDKNGKKRKATTTFLNSNVQGSMFNSMPIEIEVGGATVFVLEIDQFFKL